MKKPWVSVANSKRIGKLHPFFGTKRSKETRKRIMLALKKKRASGWEVSKEAHARGALNRSGSKHHSWNGGQLIDKDGYRRFRSEAVYKCGVKKYVLEHRLIMEKAIGKKLLPHWDVHHINENRLDNRLKNLMLFDSRSSHRRYEMGGKYDKKEILFDGRSF